MCSFMREDGVVKKRLFKRFHRWHEDPIRSGGVVSAISSRLYFDAEIPKELFSRFDPLCARGFYFCRWIKAVDLRGVKNRVVFCHRDLSRLRAFLIVFV